MSQLYHTILYDPILNLLLWVRDIVPGGDMGIAIILVTIIIKLVLILPSLSSIRSQKALQEIQPKVDEIRKKYKNDKQRQSQELLQVYRDHKVSPFSSCLPLLIQFPILIALYQVFFNGLGSVDTATGLLGANQLDHLYEPIRAIYASTPIPTDFLGFLTLTKPNVILAVFAALAQFFQSRQLMGKNPKAKQNAMTRNMLYIFPVMVFFFGLQFPAGLTLYWIMSSLFTIVQQAVYLRRTNRAPDGNTTPA